MGMELRRGPGLEKGVADRLYDSLMPLVMELVPSFPEPDPVKKKQTWYTISISKSMMDILDNSSVEIKSRELAARCFKTKSEYLACERQFGIAYPKVPESIIVTPEKGAENMVMVILALGDLSKSKGLPAFQGTVVPMRSGKLLAVPLRVYQKFEGNLGGGLGYAWIWSHKPLEADHRVIEPSLSKVMSKGS